MNDHPFLNIFGDNGVRIALTGVLSILALFLLAQTITTASNFGRANTPATDTITVNGEGQVTLAPDVARVSFTVTNSAPTVSDAQAATTRQANAAIEFVKGQGIKEKDIKTSSYNINPQYSYSDGSGMMRTPKITGYEVSETIQTTIRDLTSVGAFLGGLGKLEVQNVNGPSFMLDDSTAAYDAARADAIAKARLQAEVLAEQLGVHLGKIVNFSESSGGYQVPTMYGAGVMMSAKAVDATPDVPTGENKYTASVSITYEIR